MANSISGAGIAVTLAGAIFAYSAIKGKSISSSIRALLAGQSPASTVQANPITSPDTSLSTPGSPVASSGSTFQSQVPGYTNTYGNFFTDVLNGLGKPITQGNLNALAGVVQTEGKNNYYNPFNIEWHEGMNTAWKGVGNWNPQGVQEYANYQQGVAASVAFFSQNSGWRQFLSALASGNQSMVQAALANEYGSWGATFRPAPNPSPILSSNLGG